MRQIIFTTLSPPRLMRLSEFGFLADECVWRSLVVALREAGFVCEWIPDLVPSIADRDVLALSVSRRRILVTEDGDFGELVFRQDLPALWRAAYQAVAA
ncbi:DUF5615 family PIN-like protein [Aurantimonas sp. VKM B-3413]|uniref:DUF5615 family PIN-like protein n=1 Tax=Aurantimonas sp. VKM B-3413 TaxID=2779401 RepID=UPI001E4B114E|nr:DUF5615 family PIN-like protein [Aurantimonas sp. VKM B-3413]MCB8839576.1 DUF5615 family PIN-like protein [Aurantimonas sp. VKM B-3413]